MTLQDWITERRVRLRILDRIRRAITTALVGAPMVRDEMNFFCVWEDEPGKWTIVAYAEINGAVEAFPPDLGAETPEALEHARENFRKCGLVQIPRCHTDPANLVESWI